jgi:hypothetical protein
MRMNAPDLTKFSVAELLALNGAILVELRRRNICRTENNPTGDYAEYLAAEKLGLELNNNSKLGYDAVDPIGLRYQIKGRRITPKNHSTQLSVIRNLDNQEFDHLVALLFDENYSVLKAAKVPHGIIGEHAKYNSHQNGHILHLNTKLLGDFRVENLTAKFVN